MQAEYLDYRNTGYFSKTVLDYLDQHDNLASLYSHSPQSDSFEEEIKNQQHKDNNRVLVRDVIENQYQKIKEIGGQVSEEVERNIAALGKETAFTVTTGHQLNLFTGPLYTIYKILGTISLARKVSARHPEYTIIPLFWMATEDHDFAEINHLNIRDKNIEWKTEARGAVGRLSIHDIAATLGQVLSSIGMAPFFPDLEKIFSDAYLLNDTLAQATRYFYNALFGRFGLVILDADDARLKKRFAPIMREDILGGKSHALVSETNQELSERGYPVQVHPREINFFYLDAGIRERIVEKDGLFKVLNTTLEFSRSQLERDIDEHPEHFSPNVIMRPVYQETLLPNLAYVGGGAEVSYWLSLKSLFVHYTLPYPRLLLRNSALLVDSVTLKRIDNLGFHPSDFFKDARVLSSIYVKRFSERELDLSKQVKDLMVVLRETERKADQVHTSLGKSARSMHTRMEQMLKHLENKMLKTEKNKFDTQIAQIYKIHQRLFPKGVLQERVESFLPYYASLGPALFDHLLEAFDPLGREFTIMSI